jgi:hypothetical protein
MNVSKTKNIGIFADVIAPFTLILVTIALFFVFMPENPGTLFWFNMVYTSFLEILLLAYIIWLPRREGSVVLKWICGTFSIAYICIAFIWMVMFGLLFGNWWSLKVYFSVIAIVTAIWIFASATAVKVDNINEMSNMSLKSNRAKTDSVIKKAEMLSEQFSLLKAAHPELNQAYSSVTMLCRGLITLSPSVMSEESTAKRINAIISGLEEIFYEPFSENAAYRIKEYADNSIIILNGIKKSIRK